MTTTHHCPFRKHRHVPWETVVATDREYAEWLIGDDGPCLVPALYDHLVDLLMPGWAGACYEAAERAHECREPESARERRERSRP